MSEILLDSTPAISIVKDDTTDKVTSPINYNIDNPLLKLMRTMENATLLEEEIGFYVADSLQYLFPFSHVELYGPSGSDSDILNPEQQDNKTDFQKQNIKDFILTDTFLMRGWVTAGNQTVPFLKVSYRGDSDSVLSQKSGHKLDSYIYLYLKVGNRQSSDLIKVPYNVKTNRYEVELWGYKGSDLYDRLSTKGKDAISRGVLQQIDDLVIGNINDFAREGKDNLNMYEVAADNTMHPLNALRIELAWTDHTKTFFDSQDGQNYHYEFNMLLRGWHNYMQVGVSANPHGGVGFLHYRNLMSNYKPYSRQSELARPIMPWMFNANGHKGNEFSLDTENFLAVDYIDLHVLKPECGIGIHRHRDNQEIFFLLNGKAFMVTGDWYKFPDRERAFEIRTLLPGSFTLLKAGQLHALINSLDTDASLLMFGGYD